MNPTLHRRWLSTGASVGLFGFLNTDHDNVLVSDYQIYAEIAEWMMLHVRSQTSPADSP